MTTTSPVGRTVRGDIARPARLSPEVRAELERLRPFEEVARSMIRLRMDHHVSQEALAQRVGTAKSAISRLESGRRSPNLATLERIAAAFGRLVIGFDSAPPPKTRRAAPDLLAARRAS
jgi:DNA-binding XRE family transcriptional regulator